jgi:DNA-binding NarL/FixJ family response regulator
MVRASGLTEKDLQIMRLIAFGCSNEQIGRMLNMQPSTVRTHVDNTLRSLHVHSRAHAIAILYRNRELPVDDRGPDC